jgi:hypothetical protein
MLASRASLDYGGSREPPSVTRRRQRLTVAASNETDYTMDLAAHDHVIAAAIAAWA